MGDGWGDSGVWVPAISWWGWVSYLGDFKILMILLVLNVLRCKFSILIVDVVLFT